MKKVFSVFFIFISLIVAGITLVPALGREDSVAVSETAYYEPAAEQPISVTSKAAYLIDNATGSVLFARNETARGPIASMTKIMTLLLTFEQIDSGAMTLDDKVVISQNAASMGGSQVFLDANAEYAAGDLIKTVVVASANDSSVALAEHIAGSVEGFVSKMNSRASELGMNDTNFVNCTGLPAPGAYSTAKDVSRMTRELLKHKDYYRYTKIWTEDFVHPSGRTTNITNTNKLSRFYEGCDSGKTGYTAEAGHCLSASAKRGNTRLISVIIGGTDSKSRFADSMKLLNYGFANFESREVLGCDKPLDFKAKVIGGKTDEIDVRPARSYYEFGKKGEKSHSVEFEYRPDDKIKAPVAEGDRVGTIAVIKDGVLADEIDLVAASSVDKAGFLDTVRKIIERWGIVR